MRLDFIKPLVPYVPEVKNPPFPPTLSERVIWTGLVLLIFYSMYSIVPAGAVRVGGEFAEFIQVVLASKMGTLLTIGIGPIILASIFLQLLHGAKVLEVDYSNPEDRANFSVAQKVLAIGIAVIESFLFVLPGAYLIPNPELVGAGVPSGLLVLAIVVQVAGAAILIIFLDELVSRYGIGSGVSLFIVAGVALAIVQGAWAIVVGGMPYPSIAELLAEGALPSAFILAVLPLAFTFVLIAVCAYLEGVRVEIPIAFERVRGFGTRLPIKLLYTSVLPVILTSALLLNINMVARTLLYNASLVVGGIDIVPRIGYVAVDANGVRYLADGVLYFIAASFPSPLLIPGGYSAYLAEMTRPLPVTGLPQWVHAITYAVTFIALCVFFGHFWIEVSGMGPADIAEQITKAGLAVPGFRRDPRIVQTILEKYIGTITIVGSAIVGAIAVLADFLGVVGTGTGILLTVGIVHKFYEDLKAQGAFELYPHLQKFFE